MNNLKIEVDIREELTAQKLIVTCQSIKYPDQYFLECWEFPNGLILLDNESLPYIFFENRESIVAYDGDYVVSTEVSNPMHLFAFTPYILSPLLEEAYREFGDSKAINLGWELVNSKDDNNGDDEEDNEQVEFEFLDGSKHYLNKEDPEVVVQFILDNIDKMKKKKFTPQKRISG
jgi:hypothetical protein